MHNTHVACDLSNRAASFPINESETRPSQGRPIVIRQASNTSFLVQRRAIRHISHSQLGGLAIIVVVVVFLFCFCPFLLHARRPAGAELRPRKSGEGRKEGRKEGKRQGRMVPSADVDSTHSTFHHSK